MSISISDGNDASTGQSLQVCFVMCYHTAAEGIYFIQTHVSRIHHSYGMNWRHNWSDLDSYPTILTTQGTSLLDVTAICNLQTLHQAVEPPIRDKDRYFKTEIFGKEVMVSESAFTSRTRSMTHVISSTCTSKSGSKRFSYGTQIADQWLISQVSSCVGSPKDTLLTAKKSP